MVVLDSGGDNMERAGDFFEITTDAHSLQKVKSAVEAAGFSVQSAQPRQVPKTLVELDPDVARRLMKLIEALDDQEDVQNISSNYSIPDEVMAAIAAEASK